MICYSQNPSNAPQLLKVLMLFDHPKASNLSGMVYELQLDFLEAQGLHESVQRARAAQQRVAVCLPRVLKPNEVQTCANYTKHHQTTAHVPLTADPWFLFQGAWSGLRVVHDETGTSDFFLQDRLWQFYQRLEADVACTRKLILFTLHSVCVCVFYMFQPVLTVHLFTFPEAKAT